jgi:hypothetical protein
MQANGDGHTWQYNYFVDLMQDDFSFTGVAKTGFWQWKVTGMDVHANPIYDPAGWVASFTGVKQFHSRHHRDMQNALLQHAALLPAYLAGYC